MVKNSVALLCQAMAEFVSDTFEMVTHVAEDNPDAVKTVTNGLDVAFIMAEFVSDTFEMVTHVAEDNPDAVKTVTNGLDVAFNQLATRLSQLGD